VQSVISQTMGMLNAALDAFKQLPPNSEHYAEAAELFAKAQELLAQAQEAAIKGDYELALKLTKQAQMYAQQANDLAKLQINFTAIGEQPAPRQPGIYDQLITFAAGIAFAVGLLLVLNYLYKLRTRPR